MRNYRREPLVEKIRDSVVHVPESNAFTNQLSKFVDETQRDQDPEQHREENAKVCARARSSASRERDGTGSAPAN